jgi:hypothetical protein
MPWQLVYTSAPRGLIPGQSGFCTVARSRDLRDALSVRLEQLSAYHHVAGTDRQGRACYPCIAACRVLDIRGARYHVLTRIHDAGLDFTSRTNHIAHHLVFQPAEVVALPSPAVLLRDWPGWRRTWTEAPRFLEASDAAGLDRLPRPVLSPATRWQQLTGDAGRAAALVDPGGEYGAYLDLEPGCEFELLDLFGESLGLLLADGRKPAALWEMTFTTFLQGEDNPADFRWRGGWTGTALSEAATRAGRAPCPPGQLPVPNTAAAALARQGPPRGAPARPPSSVPSAPVRLRIEPGLAARGGARAPAAAGRVGTAEQETGVEPAHGIARPLFIGGAVGLALAALIIAGFAWPGFFVKPGRRAVEAPATLLPSEKPSPAHPAVAGPGDGAPQTDRTNAAPPVSVPAPAQRVRPDSELTAQIERVWPAVPTLVVLASGSQPAALELPAFAPLAALLAALLTDRDPVLPGEVRCELSSETLAWPGPHAPFRTAIQADLVGKRISWPDASGARTTVDFAAWQADPSRERPIVLTGPGGTAQHAVAFRLGPPAQRASAFASHRVVGLDPQSPPEPVWLDHTFLVEGQTNFWLSLRGPLRERLRQLQLPAGMRLGLRPFILQVRAKQEVDWLAQVEACGIAVNADAALDFAGVRRELERALQAARARTDEAQSRLNASLTNLLAGGPAGFQAPVGHLFGLAPGPPLGTFEVYLAGQKRAPAAARADDLLAYVRKLLDQEAVRTLGGAEIRRKLRDEPARAAAALSELDEFAAGLAKRRPPGSALPDRYFTSLHKRLREADDLRRRVDAEQDRARRCEEMLRIAPRGLAGTANVRLLAAGPGASFELIRFAEPIPPTR